MPESKSGALPLGDAPRMYHACPAGAGPSARGSTRNTRQPGYDPENGFGLPGNGRIGKNSEKRGSATAHQGADGAKTEEPVLDGGQLGDSVRW